MIERWVPKMIKGIKRESQNWVFGPKIAGRTNHPNGREQISADHDLCDEGWSQPSYGEDRIQRERESIANTRRRDSTQLWIHREACPTIGASHNHHMSKSAGRIGGVRPVLRVGEAGGLTG